MSILSEHVEQTQERLGGAHPLLPRVNLLPPEIAEAARFRRIQVGLGGGLLASLGLVALLYVGAVAGVGEAQAEFDEASATGTALQAETATYADVQASFGRAAEAEGMLTQAMGEEVRFSQYLNDLSLTVPENVWLKDVTFTQAAVAPAFGSTEPGIGTVTFSGIGFKHDDVAVWLESLAKQKGYADPYFTGSTAGVIGNRKTVSFTSSVTLTAAALSGRFTTPAGG